LAISDTVRDQLRDLQARGEMFPFKNTPRIDSFRLGSQLDMHNRDAHIRSHVRKAVETTPSGHPYVVVGTVEPRKNHHCLLNAFDHFWNQGNAHRLLIIGRRGWNSDGLEQRILQHPLFSKNLYWFPDLTDSELHYCYQHAKASIFASQAEGYGLPVVEGLQHGLPVIASGLAVHREIAGNHAAFFDPDRWEELAHLIEQLETTGTLPSVAPLNTFRPVSWRDAVTDLLEHCRNFMQENTGLHQTMGHRKAS
jgi:alpha-1,2-rhamnosyltransferase